MENVVLCCDNSNLDYNIPAVFSIDGIVCLLGTEGLMSTVLFYMQVAVRLFRVYCLHCTCRVTFELPSLQRGSPLYHTQFQF